MKSKVLTVIIPSYNTSRFIDKCIPTFLDESILDKIEVLIINDGSTDETAAVAKKYEDNYSGAVRVINKENGGHGSVINMGIREASGKYVKVVDGDDWVDTTNFIRLVNDLINENADLVINPYDKINERTGKPKKVILVEDYGKNISFDDNCDRYPQFEIPSITVKTEILKENNICVREKCYYEDSEYDLYPIVYINTITIFDYSVYQYLIGQSGQSVSASNALKNHKMHSTVISDCIQYYEQCKPHISENKMHYIENVIMKLIRSQYNIYLRNGYASDSHDAFITFNAELKAKYPSYYKEIGNRNKYIRWLQGGNIIVFKILSAAMSLYKKKFE